MPRARHRLPILLLLSVLFAFTPSDPAEALQPSTEEAETRGLVYTLQPNPWIYGYFGYGCGFSDLDGDGDPDAIVLGATHARAGVFENDGTGHFTDRTFSTGIPVLSQGSGFTAFDYDGDGDEDLYFVQWGQPNVLVRNDGGFHFTDVTATAGVGNAGAGKGSAAADFDGDGHLDLYVWNYGDILPPTVDGRNRLYRNRGDGTFEEVAALHGVDDPGEGLQAVWFDHDRDGDPDLYLSNDNRSSTATDRSNRLWRNDEGQLVDVSAASGTDVTMFSMGVACGDFDGNLWPDLYATNIPGGFGRNNPLFLNQGDGTFSEGASAAGVDNPFTSFGAIFYDFDNDGHQDLYVNNQWDPNTLYVNDGTFPAVESGAAAAVTSGFGPSFTSAVADVDLDGDLDLLVNDLGHRTKLFVNREGELRSWVRWRMVGRDANTAAIGATVETTAGGRTQIHEVLAGGNGYLGQNELTLHVGLDADTSVTEAVARWPGGGTRTLRGLSSGETWTVYPPERLGDADGDGDVDAGDFVTLAACLGLTLAPGCEVMDFDGDGDVATDDFTGGFLGAFGGPLPDCDENGEMDLDEILLDPGLDPDGDGQLDACAPPAPEGFGCPSAPAPGCAGDFGSGSLKVSEKKPGAERLSARWKRGPATTQADFGDPLGIDGTAFAWCLYDDAGTLVASILVDRAGDVCGGKACWRSVGGPPPGGKGFVYKDKALSAGGVQRIKLGSGEAGKTKVLLKARNDGEAGPGDLPTGLPAAVAGATSLTMQLLTSDAGCLSVDLPEVSVGPGSLEAKSR